MKLIFTVLLYVVCINAFSQTKICFLDSLRICNEEILRLEEYNNKLIKKHPVLRTYNDIKQFHFFVLKNPNNSDISFEEYRNYSFLNKLSFSRIIRKPSWFSKITLLSTETFLFSSEGKALGQIRYGILLPIEWVGAYNLHVLDKMIVNNEISFGFTCGALKERNNRFHGFVSGISEYFCIIQDKVYYLENFDRMCSNGEFHLTLLEDYIGSEE